MRLLLIFTLFIFCSCNKKQAEPDNVAAEVLAPRDWVKDVIKDHDYWFYLTAVPFADGGSVAMGFMNLEGEMLHVLFDYSIGHDQDYRRCYIQRSFNDLEAIELERGSKLEAKVISIIKDARLNKESRPFLPSQDKAIEILEKRDLDLKLMTEAKSIPPRKRMSVPRLPFSPN